MGHRVPHPRYPKRPELSEAFKLVRLALSEKPRSFQELVTAGLEIYARDHPSQSVKDALGLAHSIAKSPTVTAVDVTYDRRIPSDHPFRSARFLKTRVLPVLVSQQLVHKDAIRPVPGTVKQTHHEEVVDGESSFRWFLSTPKPHRAKDPMGQWSLPRHWERLCNGEQPSVVWANLKDAQRQQLIVERERRVKAGREKISERESWVRPDRMPGITTRLQRMHLSKRKARNRTKKELKMVADREAYDAMKRSAMKEAEKAFKAAQQLSGGGAVVA